MFDFQTLDIYKKAKQFYIANKFLLNEIKLDKYVNDQLSRAAFSVPLNIAEGSGKFSKRDRRNYFIISRASLYECIAIIDILYDESKISTEIYQSLLKQGEDISRILYKMIQNMNLK